jgi:integrase/recombinase XerC
MSAYPVAVEQFLEHLTVMKACSPHTIRSYGLDLKAFGAFLSPCDAVQEIDKRRVRAYLAQEHSRGASKRTLLRRLSALRSFFKFLVQRRYVAHNPMDEIDSPKREQKLPHPLSYEQVERLFALPDVGSYLGFRDRCLMELLYSSGLRVSELVGLNRKDCDLVGRLLRVRGKGRKERQVPVTASAAEWIAAYLSHPEREEKDIEAIFLNRWGRRLTARSVDRQFQVYLRASGLAAHVTPHTIRHTIATHWLEKGMDLKTIQTLLGHNSLGTTTIYTQVSTRLKRDVYGKTHPLAIRSDD